MPDSDPIITQVSTTETDENGNTVVTMYPPNSVTAGDMDAQTEPDTSGLGFGAPDGP